MLSFSLSLLLVVGSRAEDADVNKRIVFIGDSITAGYGLKKEQAYPKLIEGLAMEKKMTLTSVNAGLSGDTTSGGLRRLRILIKKPAEVFVIALGGNDGLRGLPPKVSGANLSAMVDLIQKQQPSAKILLIGMQMPQNMGKEYTEQFRKTFAEVAKSKNVVHLPFLLKGVAGKAELNLPDRIHPNAEGQKVVAQHVFTTLQAILTN
jgi:acyl-CoA thioesterase-1